MKAALRTLVPDRPAMIDLAAVVLLTVVALAAFESSFGGYGFLVLGAIATIGGAVVAYIGDRLRWPFLVTVVVAVVVYVLLASVLALGHHAIAGVIPSPNSILESLTSAVSGWKELITTSPPVGSTGDLLVIPVVSGFVSGFLSMTFARRFTLTGIAAIPPMVVLGLAIAVGTDTPVSVLLHGAIFAGVLFAWLALREHRNRPLLQGARISRRQLVTGFGVLAIAGMAGYLLGPSLPGAQASEREIWRQTVTPPFDPRQYPSPLNSYRDYVKPGYDVNGERRDAEVVFTVEGLPEGVPVRLATMDAYDGLVWQVSAGEPGNPSLNDSGSFERIGAELSPEFEGETAQVAVTIGDYNDVWIPDVGEVIKMRFTGSAGGPDRDRALADSFRYNRATDTGATTLRLQAGDRYEMTVVLPPVLENMAGEPINPEVARIGATRPIAEIPQALATPDVLVVNDTGERLDRIRDLMTETGAYSDGDIEAGQIRARAGHNAARMVEFVQDYPRTPFVGNAEQYASAYALLFRDLQKLPTRLVMGFMPSEASIDGPVEVLSTEAEAWVELPVQDLGWVGIFPTPPRDQLSSTTSSPQQPEPDYRTQNPPPPPLLDPEFDQPATASGDAQAPDDSANEADESADSAAQRNSFGDILTSPVAVGMGIVLAPLALFGLFAGIVVFIKARRRKRRRERGAPHQRIANGWNEVSDFALDMGKPVPEATTRREAAAFIGDSTMTLADRTDAAVWGGGDLTDEQVNSYWDELSATLGSMKGQLGVVDRIKATTSIQSLKRRTRGEAEDA